MTIISKLSFPFTGVRHSASLKLM